MKKNYPDLRSLDEIDERVDELRAELQNLSAEFEGRRFDDEARERWNRLNEEISHWAGTRTEMAKRRERMRELALNPHATERASVEFDPKVDAAVRVASVGEERPWRAGDPPPPLAPSPEQTRRLFVGLQRGQATRLETRAAVLTAGTGADGLAHVPAVRARQPRRLAAAAGLPTENVAGVESVRFPVFGAGDAGVTAEGAAKTEYAAITPDSATPQVIALWTDFSSQVRWTMPQFEARLRNVLAAKIAQREDKLLVDTVTATTGIQTLDAAALDVDALLEGAALVAAGDVGAEPNLALVNPADIAAVVGSTVGTGGSASPDLAAFLPVVNGMRIYPSSYVAAGTALVGAWGAAASLVVGMAPTYVLDPFTQMKSNTVTLLGEEAVALAVYEPSGFCKIAPAV